MQNGRRLQQEHDKWRSGEKNKHKILPNARELQNVPEVPEQWRFGTVNKNDLKKDQSLPAKTGRVKKKIKAIR